MELSDLRVLVAVARAGGISQATTELHAVQSSVSARIAGLEKDLGAVLLRRHARGVALTPAGEQFLDYAQRIISLADEAARVVRDHTPSGPLRIGAMETTVALRLPEVLASFTGAWPKVDLSLLTGPSDTLVAAVKDHTLDAALVAGPLADPDLDEEPVCEEELVLISARRFGDLDQLLGSQTARRLIVFRSGCSYRRRLEALLRTRGVAPEKVFDYGSIEGILACVAAGLGITMLPAALIERAEQRSGLQPHRLTPSESTAPTVIVRRRDTHPTAALRQFHQHLLGTPDPYAEPSLTTNDS